MVQEFNFLMFIFQSALDNGLPKLYLTFRSYYSFMNFEQFSEIAIQKQLLQNIESIQHKIWKTKDMLVKKKKIHSKLNKGGFLKADKHW